MKYSKNIIRGDTSEHCPKQTMINANKTYHFKLAWQLNHLIYLINLCFATCLIWTIMVVSGSLYKQVDLLTKSMMVNTWKRMQDSTHFPWWHPENFPKHTVKIWQKCMKTDEWFYKLPSNGRIHPEANDVNKIDKLSSHQNMWRIQQVWQTILWKWSQASNQDM